MHTDNSFRYKTSWYILLYVVSIFLSFWNGITNYVLCTVYVNINANACGFKSIVPVKELSFWRYYCAWNYISLSSYIKINLCYNNFIFPIPIYYPSLTLIDSRFIAVDLWHDLQKLLRRICFCRESHLLSQPSQKLKNLSGNWFLWWMFESNKS